MRKLLLATVATAGAMLAATGAANAQPVKPVAPGTLVVHLNGYLQFEIAGFGSTFNNVTSAGNTVYTAGNGVINRSVVGAGSYKLNTISTNGDARIYPGFDAQTLNGIEYGAQVEIRTGRSDSNVGANQTTGTAGTAGLDGLYVKRAYGYLGTKYAGFLRGGQTDSAFTLLQAGEIEAFGDGAQFNSDGGLVSLLPSAATPGNFTFADQSALYATDKVVYISPAIEGFSVSGGYEPNSNGLKEGYGDCTTAAQLNTAGTATVCANESTSPIVGDIGKKRKNTVDGMVAYSFKGYGAVIKASGGILYGAPIQYSGPETATGTATRLGYDDLLVYQGGAQVTYAGLTLGANIKAGQVEDSYAFKPRGARDGLVYYVGASYVIGPFVLGGSYFNSQTSGAFVPGVGPQVTKGPAIARTLSEYGIAGGGNLVISPNLSLWVQYLYGHKHQPGVAFGGVSTVTTGGAGAAGKTVKTANGPIGNAQVQAVGAGFTFKW